jgi:Protein of unknown function (DUF3593)
MSGGLVDLAIASDQQFQSLNSGGLKSKTMSLFSKESLFALSLFPYLGFLWFLTRSGQTPRLALIGFYMTLVFVAVTIPAGIYAQVHYGEMLANVDWLHGGAEVFLTLSNILVVLGFRQALQQRRSP